MKKLANKIILLFVAFELAASRTLPPEYQQRIDHETDDIQEQHRNEQIRLINDFAKTREKFGNDWKRVASETEMKIENIKNRVAEEYTSNQLESVRMNWDGHANEIIKARESDKFLDNYLRGGDGTLPRGGDGAVLGPQEVFDSKKGEFSSAVSSDQFLQSYLDEDANAVFQKKLESIKYAEESDVLIEKYLLGNP